MANAIKPAMSANQSDHCAIRPTSGWVSSSSVAASSPMTITPRMRRSASHQHAANKK
jgi:hypothetical protein